MKVERVVVISPWQVEEVQEQIEKVEMVFS